jgi:hypothetical protein
LNALDKPGTDDASKILAIVYILLPLSIIIFSILTLDLIAIGIYLFLLRRHKESAGPKKTIVAVIAFIILLYFVGGGLLHNFLEGRRLNNATKPPTDSQVLDLIDSCSISSLTKIGNNVTLFYSSNFNLDDSKTATPNSTEVSATSWNRFVNEVKIARPHCIGFIAVNNQGVNPNYNWISVQQATDLLQQCEVDVLGYSPPLSPGKPSSGTPTGIILESGLPFSNLYIEPSQESTMVPIAKAARSKCGAPIFYHDGKNEIRQTDGTWK